MASRKNTLTPNLFMSREELAEKFQDCARGLLSPFAEPQAQGLIYRREGLEDVKDSWHC